MQNEELLNNLDTLKGIIHKMSTLPDDYDALQSAERYEQMCSFAIDACRKYLLAVDNCNRIRGYLLASVMTEEPVSLNMREDITRLMAYPEVREQLTASKDENTLWLRQVLTCGRPIAPTFKEFSDVIAVIIPELKPCIDFEHRSIYHKHNVYEHLLAVVDGCHTRDFTVKMAALLHDIGKPHVYTTDDEGYRHYRGHAVESVRIAELLLTRLGIAGKEKATILSLIECHDMELAPSKKSVKRAMNEYGADFIRKWAVLRRADRDDHIFPCGTNTRFYTDIDGILTILDEIEAEEKRFKVTDLRVNGYDLMKLGLSGEDIGYMLNTLRDAVASGELDNDRDWLLVKASQIIEHDKEQDIER